MSKAPSISPSFQPLDAYLNTWFPSHLPGIGVLVQRKGETLYARNFGLANMQTGQKISSSTNFRMASLTKQFTAMAVLLLEKENQLRFTDKVSLFLPSFSKNRSEITIGHLLNHTSGLPDFEDAIDEHRTNQVRDEQVLEIAAGNKEGFFKPGNQFRYSNTGFVVLAILVQQVSGLPFGLFLRQHIFQPLGMNDTKLFAPCIEIKERALGYAPGEHDSFYLADQSLWSATMGDGCLYTSLQDYQKWLSALLHHPSFPLLPALHLNEFQVKPGTNWKYGMGWFLAEKKSGSLEMYHTGNSSGFSHVVAFLPKQETWVMAFSNRADNQHLIPNIIRLAFQGLSYSLESEVVWELPGLTR